MDKKNSKMHINSSGTKIWKNSIGQFHRINGPAKEYLNGDKYWFKYDIPHRLDGPAVEWPSGYKAWYKEGKLHRLDGPAYIWRECKKYCILGTNLYKKDFNSWIKRIQLCR